jgi:hypothetical protein
MSYLTVLFLFFVILAVVTDLSRGDNLNAAKTFLKEYFIRDTVIETVFEEASTIIVFSRYIFSTFSSIFLYKLPVNIFNKF